MDCMFDYPCLAYVFVWREAQYLLCYTAPVVDTSVIPV